MHVGMSLFFQNLRGVSDEQVWLDELALAELAEPLGFDSVWSVEHHFTSYTMSPDVLQFLTYMAARTTKVQLGSMVVVLPWHDPVRVAEQIAVLDIVSGGRVVLGMGRGLGRIESDLARAGCQRALLDQRHQPAAQAVRLQRRLDGELAERGNVVAVVPMTVPVASRLRGRLEGDRSDDRAMHFRHETLCFRKSDGQWRIAHAHESVPYYMDGSVKAAVDLKP